MARTIAFSFPFAGLDLAVSGTFYKGQRGSRNEPPEPAIFEVEDCKVGDVEFEHTGVYVKGFSGQTICLTELLEERGCEEGADDSDIGDWRRDQRVDALLQAAE